MVWHGCVRRQSRRTRPWLDVAPRPSPPAAGSTVPHAVFTAKRGFGGRTLWRGARHKTKKIHAVLASTARREERELFRSESLRNSVSRLPAGRGGESPSGTDLIPGKSTPCSPARRGEKRESLRGTRMVPKVLTRSVERGRKRDVGIGGHQRHHLGGQVRRAEHPAAAHPQSRAVV